MARTHRDRAFASLHHVLDLDWMLEAYRTTRKDGAAGVDGVTAAEYAETLEANLLDLLDRVKSGRYQAQGNRVKPIHSYPTRTTDLRRAWTGVIIPHQVEAEWESCPISLAQMGANSFTRLP